MTLIVWVAVSLYSATVSCVQLILSSEIQQGITARHLCSVRTMLKVTWTAILCVCVCMFTYFYWACSLFLFFIALSQALLKSPVLPWIVPFGFNHYRLFLSPNMYCIYRRENFISWSKHLSIYLRCRQDILMILWNWYSFPQGWLWYWDYVGDSLYS